jgi:hypothetical protein
MTTANAKLADKAFRAARAKHYGNGVKDLLRRAIDRTKDAHDRCKQPSSTPDSDGSKAIARLAIVLEGRLQALEHVWEAMHGNKAWLRNWGNE